LEVMASEPSDATTATNGVERGHNAHTRPHTMMAPMPAISTALSARWSVPGTAHPSPRKVPNTHPSTK
jgi:hypothetical protein